MKKEEGLIVLGVLVAVLIFMKKACPVCEGDIAVHAI